MTFETPTPPVPELGASVEWRSMVWTPAVAWALDRARHQLRPGARVLEVGFYSGMMSCYLAATHRVYVVGIEQDPSALEIARANARMFGVEARTDFRFVPRDETLSFSDAFDAVFMKSVLYRIPEPDEYRRWLLWVYRNLVPGGVFIAIENGRGDGLTRFYRTRLSHKPWANNMLMDPEALGLFRQTFDAVDAKFFGRFSQFLEGHPRMADITRRIEERVLPPDEARHFVAAIVAERANSALA